MKRGAITLFRARGLGAGSNRWFLIGIGVALLIGIFLIDYMIGSQYAMAVFYLMPIFLITRGAGLEAGIIASAVAVASERLALELNGHHPGWSVIVWNSGGKLIMYIFITTMVYRLREEVAAERLLARRDFLTGVGNKLDFFEAAEHEFRRSRRYKHPLTLAYIDCDNFKLMNDEFGHEGGDVLLQRVADSLLRSLRSTDYVARFGGDEFIVMLPETEENASRRVLQKVQENLQRMLGENQWPVTISAGAVTFYEPPDSPEDAVLLADKVMYAAKKAGKNRVEHFVYGTPAAASGTSAA